jgi:tetratricopeptide (TPR) repeat protein
VQKLWLGLSLVALVGCATPRHERRVAIQPLEARARDLMDDDRLHVAMRLLMSQVGRSKPGPARTRAEVLLVEVGRRIDDRLVLPVWLEANIGARLWKLPLSAEQRTWAHYALGSHDARKGDSEAAIAHLEEVPASSEHYPRAQFRMGLIAAGHRRDAIAGRKHFENAGEVARRKGQADVASEAESALARLDYEAGDFEASVARYTTILSDAASDDPRHIERAWAHYRSGNDDAAWDAMQGLDPRRTPEVAVLRAAVRLRQCVLSEAVELAGAILDPAFEVAPPPTHVRLARLEARSARAKAELEGLEDASLITYGQQEAEQWRDFATIIRSEEARRQAIFVEDFQRRARVVRLEAAWRLAGEDAATPCVSAVDASNADTWRIVAALDAEVILESPRPPTRDPIAVAEILRIAALWNPAHERALPWLERALAVYDAPPDGHDATEVAASRRRVLLQVGDVHFLRGRAAEARKAYVEAARSGPSPGEDLYARYGSAWAAWAEGDVDAANKTMRAVLRDARAVAQAPLVEAAREALTLFR